MLHFRTILLWLAFLLLILQHFIFFNDITIGLIFRLIPSGILLLWFLLSVFIKENLKIKTSGLSKTLLFFIRILRPAASITIVLGALFKILHWPFGNLMLISGIGFMAVYSTILSKVSIRSEEYNPDILDDFDD
jgi:hypothetical protein